MSESLKPRKNQLDTMEWRTAFHEAAHAVASVRLDQRFTYVTVDADGDAAGHTQYVEGTGIVDPDLFNRNNPDHWRLLDAEAVTSFAGAFGEMLIRTDLPIDDALDIIEEGAEGDADDLDDLLEDIFDDYDDLARYDEQQHQKAFELVFQAENRLAIIAVARALRQRRHMTWSDVVEVVAESDNGLASE